MNKQSENIKITAAVPIKVDNLMRRQAFNAKLTLGEMLELYQAAYNNKLEVEKSQKIRATCKSCKKSYYPSNL